VEKQEPTTSNEAMHVANRLERYEYDNMHFEKSHENWSHIWSYENLNLSSKSEGNKLTLNNQ
jgi:hypothetical protein